MKQKIALSITILALVIPCALPLFAADSSPTNPHKFTSTEDLSRIRTLIVPHDYSPLGEDARKTLETGISELERAISQNDQNPETYLLLAEGYEKLRLAYYQRDSEKDIEFINKQKEVCLKGLSINPIHDSLRIFYAQLLSVDDRIAQFEIVLKRNPGNMEARFRYAAAFFLLKEDVERGTQEIAKVVADNEGLLKYRVQIATIYRAYNLTSELKKMEKRLREIEK